MSPVSGDSRPGTARDLKSGIERFRLGDRPDVTVLYPDVCFASLDAVGDMPADLLVDSVLDGWRREDRLTTAPGGEAVGAPFPVAALVVSRDNREAFHPELSNREPVEIQVWADGRITLEIEFQGADVTNEPAAWAETARIVLGSWAGSYGVRLLAVFNDRARSLPDVWNATFEVTDHDAQVLDLVQLGERALSTVELSMTGWGGELAVRRLLSEGDVHAVLAWRPSAVLDFWPSPPQPHEQELFAADVCALANSVRGGALIVGVRHGTEGSELAPFERGTLEDELGELLRSRLHPVPEGLVVRFVPARVELSDRGDEPERADVGLVVVRIPPQDELLRPFLLHSGGNVRDGNVVQSIAMVERQGTETVGRSVAALHTALSAGMALLARGELSGDWPERG
jgi:hypothetical protein